ncbi:MAG: hypothetical protein KBA95_06575 [Acidobacteria bacterium]|nr:hypothetical protein [Acidobacteriota bacterium]
MRWLPFLALAGLALGTPSGQALQPGQIVEKVVCTQAPAQSYALYLPSNYTPGRAWPVLYAFDAMARGLVPVERFRDAAERYGYIVAGSNNSRNGPIEVADAALRAMLADTSARFSVDVERLYFTGFSGGARVAVLAALGAGDRAAGVIGCGGGFPLGLQPAAGIPFAYLGVAGVDDFNYTEMHELDATLARLSIPHRLEVFDGGHSWPSPEFCVRAIEWMEIQAIRTRSRGADDTLIDRILARASGEAAAEEQAGRAVEAYRRYSALAAMMAGLRDVAPFERKARELRALPEVRSAVKEEADSMPREKAAKERFARVVIDALEGEDRTLAMQELLRTVEEMRAQAERPRRDAGRMAARRVLVSSWSWMNEENARDIEAGRPARAAERLSLMARIRPADAAVDYQRARALALDGKKGAAIDALRSAVKKGFDDGAAIDAEPAFAPLRQEREFQEIVERLRRHGA